MSYESYGEYQLLKKLASGGMASIFLARQAGLEGFEKLMVVKRILPHLAENEDFVKMFLDEARIAARLNHPNIVQIFNLGAQGDTYFIAMEYIHGEDARRVWKRADAESKPIPVPLVCRIVMDAAAGLDYAHKRTDANGKPLGIVHRDVSPQNILVTFEGTVKVVDFGIAKAVDQATITRSGVLKGKYSYMSPEQAAGGKIDHRTDIFALGIVLFELLTGTRLFKRGNDLQTLNAVAECDVPPPSTVNERLPKSLDAIILKALSRSLEGRYQTAAELQVALDGWLIANKQPSSSVHLAAFMRDVYAERLKREQAEGRVLVEEQHLSMDPELLDISPRNRQGEPTASVAKPGPPVPDDREVTNADHSASAEKAQDAAEAALYTGWPERSRNTHQTESAQSTQGSASVSVSSSSVSVTQADPRGRPFPWGWMALLGALGLSVGAALVFLRTGSGAVVHLDSEPEQAAVTLDGEVMQMLLTPCALPKLQGGAHTLVLTKRGYARLETSITVPDRGDLRLPVFNLEPQPEPAPSPSSAPEPAAAPEADSALHKPEPSALSLAKKELGTVRFTGRAGAKVVCGDLDLGTLPVKDQQLPAGNYRCTFTAADGKEGRTQNVTVEANAVTKVAVTSKP